MSTAGGRLPYPGLRSFTREETDLFFGREGCVDDMVDRLAATRFLAVLGASGSGKSSLVKTGLLDALEIGLLHQAGSRWLIIDFRPGEHPMQSLAEALIRAASADPSAPPDEEEAKLLRTFLARGPRSVVEWCEANLPEGANLLLLVDQFEELFRYGAYSEREEAEAFVATLLESARAPLEQARIYVAITMRSEYLGAAALIDGLAEAINQGLYLTPRMGREEVREAIVGPAAVCGFSIEPALVNRLLNDLTSFAPWDDADTGHQLERLVRRADQLPLMQHVLNRLWSIAAERTTNGQIVLKLADYEALGGLRGALAAHGREILDELLPEHRALAAAVFRALIAGSSLAEAVRKPTEFSELVEVAGGDEIAVREIVEAFRAPGRNFLMPPRPTPLRPTTLIDISHESLIRQWEEFAGWLQLEVTAADTWRRLVDAAERYKRGEANLLSDLALASNASWWDRELPTAAWAKRYGGDFGQAAKFLADSRAAELKSKDAEAKEQRQKSRNRMVTAAVIVILCIVTPLTGFAGYSAWRANQERAAAEIERQRALDSAQKEAAARAEADQQREAAEAERQRALDAAQAEAAARTEADRLRVAAEADRQRAVDSAAAEAAARAEADRLREAAEADRQRAVDAAAAEAKAQEQILALERQRAEEERHRVEQEKQRAELAHAEFQRANLGQLAERVSSLQRAGSWDAASNLLGAFWHDLIEPNPALKSNLLIDPIAEALARQRFGDYPVIPEFLSYSGLSGWTGTYGRFRVYALDKKASDGDTATGNKIITLLDAMSGAAIGTFELQPGEDLGSELDLVTPDGRRVAIVTAEPSSDDTNDDRQIALWANTQDAPIMIPMPALGGEVDLDQIAPVNADADYGLYFLVDSNPSEVSFVDAAQGVISFSATTADIAKAMEYDSIDSVTLLGVSGGQVFMLVNGANDGRVLSLDTKSETVREIVTGGGVTGAELTPDAALLLTLTCSGDCSTQSLTAYDLSDDQPLWVESVPSGMVFTDTSVHDVVVDGKPTYSALLHNYGTGIVFNIPKDRSAAVTRVPAGSAERVGFYAHDASGGYKTVESGSDVTSSDGVDAAGVLANYRVPLSRQKLRLYVAPNSIAVYQDKDAIRVAGVTYDGDLLVYRMRPDGSFEEDVSFRSTAIAESNCISAVAFSSDGHSLLFRHIDESLTYVAAVGYGASVGWHQGFSARPGESRIELSESTPATTCDAPDNSASEFVTERIVPSDTVPGAFALLDKGGAVWWVSVSGGADDAQAREGQRSIGASTTTTATREFRPLERAGDGRIWIAGDPQRHRIAMVSRSAVDILPRPSEATGDAAQGTQNVARRAKLLGKSDPKAVTFTPAGDAVVAYGDGSMTGFREGGDDWSKLFDASFFLRGAIRGLFATDDRIAIADDRHVIDALDPTTGALTGVARAPANPSLIALGSDGNVISIEWDTDSVAAVNFAEPASADAIDDTARLVTMRSPLDPEPDTSLDALMIDQEMERSLAGGEEKPNALSCDEAVAAHLAALETQLLGDAGSAEPAAATSNCAEATEDSALNAAEALARRGQVASVRELVEDGAFSRVLQAAVAGDRAATRILGAVLARIAIERGDLDQTTVAADALRFGTSFPVAILKDIAAGKPIALNLLDAARAHNGADPAVSQLLGHAEERQINDVDSLTAALFDFAIAERLYREGGRTRDAEFVAHRRAQLARLLPDARVLAVGARLDAWRPDDAGVSASATLPELPPESTARHTLDMENADKLAELLPDSPLLDTLRTELERARIFDLRASDPKGAADLLIALGQRNASATGWSPDLVGEYLDLAREIGGKSDPESVFRLSVEAVKQIAAGLKAPIDTDAEASDLFVRAADLIAATAQLAPRETVVAGTDSLDLGFLSYTYDSLPAIGATAEVRAAEDVLDAATKMTKAVAAVADDPGQWNWLGAQSLFWRGVLVNDHDTTEAANILKASAEMMRPFVDASPDDAAVRYGYAEALRWVGIALPSTQETEDTELEAVKQYQVIWENRGGLDAGLLSRVGTGYGFGLANLAQTMREVELADLDDGRSADEHAAWVLDILAFAAEKEKVNADLIDAGATTADSGFMTGWYRMSSYGWPIGFLSGRINVERGGETVTKCDLMAADPYDPLRRAPGLTLDKVDIAAAEPECKAEHEKNPDDGRTAYEFARVMSSDMTREAEFMPIAREAAAKGVSPAFSLVAYALSQKDDSRSGDAYIATTQHTLIESFPVLFPFLAAQANTDRERVGLAWYAAKAAELGMPEAHLALVDLGDDPAEQLFHAKLAARLFTEAGNKQASIEARRKADAIDVPQAQAKEIDSNVAAWEPRALVELPAADADSS